MTSKLTFSFSDEQGRAVHSGRIIRWHKGVGDAVDYGDLLFDVQVNEVLVSPMSQAIVKMARGFDKRPAGIVKALRERGARGGRPPRRVSDAELSPESWYFFLRVRSSDRGTLRRVVRDRRYEVGDLVAVFDGFNEETAATSRDLADARDFRVSTGPLEADPRLPLHADAVDVAPSSAVAATAEKEVAQASGANYLLFRRGDSAKRQIGIYLRGDCGLDRVFACKPLIEPSFEGSCCIIHDGTVADARSDLLLQSLEGIPEEWVKPLGGQLQIDPGFVKPTLFDPAFPVFPPTGPEEFPKTVVFLSLGADVTRTLYRHRDRGFLVDPGGGWLNEPIQRFLKDLSGIAWFRKTFRSVGKMTAAGFYENYRRVIPILRERAGSEIIVFNCSTIEKTSDVHNYQFVTNSDTIRRLEMNLALAELSRELDFAVLDVDRIVKRVGIQTMFDWDHAHPKVNLLIAEEAVRIMRDRDVL